MLHVLKKHPTIIALLLVITIAGCSREPDAPPEAAFRFRLHDGSTSVVRTQVLEDASSIEAPVGHHAVVFTVENGFTPDDGQQALNIVIADPLEGMQVGIITDDGSRGMSTTVPDTEGLVMIEVPVEPAQPGSGFFVTYPTNSATPRISAAGIAPRSALFDRSGGVTRLGSKLRIDHFDQQTRRSARATLTPALISRLPGEPWTIAVSFEPRDNEASQSGITAGRIEFTAPDGSKRQTMNLVLTPGNRQLFFPEGIVGFIPGMISIEVEPGMLIETIEVQPNGLIGNDTIYPAIPADLGVINGFEQRLWRHPRFELYRWNAADNVLIFDFADYEIQRDMFARLGFFVAVIGEAGRIFPEEHYEGRHSYNAHDYRPEDLTRFFNIAAETGITLNEWETFLQDLMVDYDIVRVSPAGFTEGSGAVLSYARPIWSVLRARLLRHEAVHGVFYVSSVFRDGAFELWENMSDLEQEYWRLFLANKGRMDGREGYDGYDVDRLYLLVNELAGHVLQLNAQEVNPYFRDHYSRRIREVVPAASETIELLLASEPDVFVKTRRNLELLLEAATGIRGGRMMAVVPVQ